MERRRLPANARKTSMVDSTATLEIRTDRASGVASMPAVKGTLRKCGPILLLVVRVSR